MENISVLIIEDEQVAYKNLERMLKANPESIEVIGWCQSVEQAKKWLKENPLPSLIFLDIQLGDGLSFSIFQNQNIECPIIFSTAYDEYALKAFELNSIDYLLKPFSQKKLNNALAKFKQRTSQLLFSQQQLMAMMQQMQTPTKEYKDRFHVKKGSRLVVIKTEDIAWFQRGDYVFLMTHSGQKFHLDYSLDQIYDTINPKQFYRLNRQFIAHIDAIQKIETFFNYKLKITLKPTTDSEVFVAKDNAKVFKEWLG